MKFDMKKFIKKSLLVSLMLGSSAFMFNNIYAATTSSIKATDQEIKAVQELQSNVSKAYKEWLEKNPKATQEEKNKKNEAITTEAYNNLSSDNKKLVDSYVKKASSNLSSSKNTQKTSTKTQTKTSSSSKKATKSAKTKTGDPCSVSLLGLSLFGSLSSCIFSRKKN
jgi:ABC-type antimicrobial peptide transport system permease subunit